MLNERVGRYKIVEKLAQGGMGEVYLAVHELMGREAVVKVLHPKLSHDADLVTRFFNEARAAAQIEHPGIVEVYDLDRTEDGRGYIVMERLRGQTLAERLRGGRLAIDHAVAIVRQLAGALGAAHAQNIVHRDLKPENVFLVPDPEMPEGERVKVVDFGVAKLVEQQEGENLTATGSIFGTPAYMAPEQCTDAAQVDHRADLYAIGCILYELLCGQPPFGRGGLELLAAHLRDDPSPPSHHNPAISSDVEAAILCLLAKNPDERFQNAAALVRALGGADTSPPPARVGNPPGDVAFAATLDPRTGQRDSADTPPPASSAAQTMSPSDPRLQPTTYRRASGQIAHNPDPAASRWSRLGFVALAVMVVAAGGAFALVSQTRSAGHDPGVARPGDGDDADAPKPPVADTGHPVKPAVTWPGLYRARKALDDRRWEDALFAARSILDGDEGIPDEVRAETDTILAMARKGQNDLYDYESFVETLDDVADPSNLSRAYGQLDEASPYREEATAAYEKIRDEWLEPRVEQAREYLGNKRCKAIDAIALDVSLHFPDSVGQFHRMYRGCRRKVRQDKQGSSGNDLLEEMGDDDGGDGPTEPKDDDATTKPGDGEPAGGRDPHVAATDGKAGDKRRQGAGTTRDESARTDDAPESEKPDPRTASASPPDGDEAARRDLPKQLSRAEFKSKMGKAQAGLQNRCAGHYRVVGKHRVSLDIGADGEVTAASIAHDNADFRGCVEAVLGAIQFEPARQSSKLQYTMTFRAGKKPKTRRKGPRAKKPTRRGTRRGR